MIWETSTPTSPRRSEIQGPLRSVIRPVSTSVPVTTTPARTPSLMGSPFPARPRVRTVAGGSIANAAGPCSSLTFALIAADEEVELAPVVTRRKAEGLEALALESVLAARAAEDPVDQGLLAVGAQKADLKAVRHSPPGAS